MHISVLGPLTVDAGHIRPRDRVILAALAVRRGAIVSADELAEACWGDDQPGTWWQQVKTAVARIRAVLGQDSIRTEGQGYAFGLDAGVLDAEQFERMVTAGREHAIRGDHDRAADSLRRSLTLWRGPAFPEVADWPPARIEASRLAEIKTSAEEELLDARLERGESASVIAEAQRLVREEPLRESRWAILALANYRGQRQGEALAVLREARTRLADTLGIEPGERLTRLESAILRQDPAITGSTDAAQGSDQCPYLGLRTFDADSADRFFGRDDEVATLLSRARRGEVLAVVGPSGSGKSSLLLAGVVPALRDIGSSTGQLVLQPGVAAHADRLASGRPMVDVVVVDQFEDLFQLENSEHDRVVASLAEMLADGVTLALSLRSDHLDRATGLDGIGAAIGAGVFALGPLGTAGIREAIEGPARLSGLRLEPGLVEVVLREAGERLAALPHLSHALVETWARREGTTLTVDGYTDAGGIAGAIAISAEERFRQLDAAEQESCHSLMLRLVERDEAGAIVRRRVLLAPILGDLRRRRVIEQLVAARLLAIDGEWLTVAHEAVARAWPRLEGWLQDDAESAALLRRLESGAAAWAASDRANEDLPRGTRLAAFLEWRDTTDPDLTDLEREYLQTADAARRDELAEVTARVTRQRRQNRWLRIAFGVASGLLVIALVASSIAFFSQREAVLANEDARIEALAATAHALADSDLDAALLIAAELHRRYPDDVRVRSALLGLLESPGLPDSKIMYPSDQRIFSGVLPGTNTMLVASDVVAASDDGLGTRLTLWDMTDSTKIEELPIALPDYASPYPGGIHVQDSGTLAVISYSVVIASDLGQFTSVLATVDLTTGELVAGPVEVPYGLGPDGVFIDEGATLVLRPWESAAPVWIDVATLEYHREGVSKVEGQTYPWSATTLLGDGTLAVGEPGWLHVYDPVTRKPLRSVPVAGDLDTRQLQPLDDGMLLASGTDGVALIDPSDGSVRWQFDHHAGCWQFEVLQEQGTFVCVGGDHVERLLSDGALTGRSYPAQAEWIYQSDRLADGSMVVTNLRETPFVQRFDTDGTGPISKLVAAGQMAAGGFADDRTIVTTKRTVDPWNDYDPQTLWDIVDDKAVGSPSDAIDVLGQGVVARYTESPEEQTFETVDGSRSWALSGGSLSENQNIRTMQGSPHGLAFAIDNDWIQAFDATTGEAVGKPLDFTGENLSSTWVMAHGAVGSDLAVVTWWQWDVVDEITATYDLRSGEELSRGLRGDTGSIMLPGGDIVSTSSSELRRSGSDLTPLLSLPKPVSGANVFELSGDGNTLLISGGTEPAVLYDMTTNSKLGIDIPVDSPFYYSGHLSDDGNTLVTNATNGVLVWNLDTDNAAATACRLTGRSFTRTEWTRYFGDDPYNDTCGFGAASSP